MSKAPECIFAKVNGFTTRHPDGSRALIGGWCARPEDRAIEYVRADLVPAPSVSVKPLEWVKSHFMKWNGDWHTVPTGYTIRCADEYGWKWSSTRGAFGYCVSDDAAKAAAQADYEDRILAAIRIGPAPGWHPIETAPRDEVVLMAWLYRGEWQYEAGLAGSTRGGWLHGQATHWMPLPAPPSEGDTP